MVTQELLPRDVHHNVPAMPRKTVQGDRMLSIDQPLTFLVLSLRPRNWVSKRSDGATTLAYPVLVDL